MQTLVIIAGIVVYLLWSFVNTSIAHGKGMYEGFGGFLWAFGASLIFTPLLVYLAVAGSPDYRTHRLLEEIRQELLLGRHQIASRLSKDSTTSSP